MTDDKDEPPGADEAEEKDQADERDEPAEEPSAPPPRGNKLAALLIAGGVTAISGAAITWAFHPDHARSPLVLAVMGATYALLLLGTIGWLRRRGELRERLAPKSGDLTIGALVAATSYMIATIGHVAMSGRFDSEDVWLQRVYLQIGDPTTPAPFMVGIAVLAIAAVEEVVWRGWVMGALADAFGARAGWLGSAALYALAHVPTLWLLGEHYFGPNPLVMAAAFGGGLLWGYMVSRFERLGPAIFAHALFSWAIVDFPLSRM